ncbi:lipoprotein-releasing system permease protein [Mucilaginibacter gracilis]|uniref:Lipoprotein-releasing system permease protein n=1 Tax=Mucilaginibacter gracilis TaxID=423350 RepID=A0A495J8E8_9SPHI|nr:FtsX-like permease family protein [Mucilaginibacter gracilis]RKR84728.1 lipoprotein-releasing system permease protein [Mucilaginibacter gracilis]
MKYNHHIDSEISFTYIVNQKKLTLVAALGVTIGIAVYIFMSSMTAGFSRSTDASIFKTTPHIRIYKDDEISRSLISNDKTGKQLAIIVNPRVIPQSDKIINPDQIVSLLKQQPHVSVVSPQVTVTVFYNNGQSLINGIASGVNIEDADKMFNIQSTVVEGNMTDLNTIPNGILLGSGIADKMNVKTGDNITLTSSRNVIKVMKVAGIFQTKNSGVDKTKSYIGISAARQLLKQSPTYVSDINVDVTDFNSAPFYAVQFSKLTGYRAEDWQSANQTLVAGSAMREIVITGISLSILLVAGFGIYNILNMTISQKINDIAILKAMGFRGRDVIRIFVLQAFTIGMIGLLMGCLLSWLFVWELSKTYIGGDIGYFPIGFEPAVYLRSIMLGMGITLLAGLIPAMKAANVDPVSIFRK